MTVLLLAVGSAGDVHPFIGIGMALKRRGHRVRVITNPFFENLVNKVGLEFIPMGSIEEFDAVRKNPDLWHKTKGFLMIAGLVSRALRQTYDAIVDNYVPGETVVAASSLGFASRIAQDKHGIPTATVHLAPSVLRSAIDPPILPMLSMLRWLPIGLRQMVYGLVDPLIDRLLAPAVNELCAELGLPKVRGIMKDWQNSPQRVIGMFPQWFAKSPGDWPPQTRLTGFPMYDERGVSDLSPDLDEFLKAGEAPIVFTPGSAMWHAHDIFRESAVACVRLNRRGILLSSHADHIPKNLPPNVRAFGYAPFSQLLPRTAALVHHGGIGTSSQAMAAGVKQVVTPFGFDQFDNAARMERLGVSKTIDPRRYRCKTISKILGEALADDGMTQRCKEISARFVGTTPLDDTCELIESLMPQSSPSLTATH